MKSPFELYSYYEGDIHWIINIDIERLRIAKDYQLRNEYSIELIESNLLPIDHFLLQKGELQRDISHKKRWVGSPFDLHSNNEIDEIIAIVWSLYFQHTILPQLRKRTQFYGGIRQTNNPVLVSSTMCKKCCACC